MLRGKRDGQVITEMDYDEMNRREEMTVQAKVTG